MAAPDADDDADADAAAEDADALEAAADADDALAEPAADALAADAEADPRASPHPGNARAAAPRTAAVVTLKNERLLYNMLTSFQTTCLKAPTSGFTHQYRAIVSSALRVSPYSTTRLPPLPKLNHFSFSS